MAKSYTFTLEYEALARQDITIEAQDDQEALKMLNDLIQGEAIEHEEELPETEETATELGAYGWETVTCWGDGDKEAFCELDQDEIRSIISRGTEAKAEVDQ